MITVIGLLAACFGVMLVTTFAIFLSLEGDDVRANTVATTLAFVAGIGLVIVFTLNVSGVA